MRIGIPNRSSLLHVGAITQCLTGGLLPWSEYHPAKLYYRLPGDELLLFRCDDLCKCFAAGELDVIFTGDDYAGEHLQSDEYECTSFAFVSTRFALLSVNPSRNQQFDQVFTKFPETAKKYLARWNVAYNEIQVMSGGCECFASCVPSSAAFDVICTGTTRQVNKLCAVHQGDAFGCSWYFRRGKLIESLARVVANKEILTRLQSHYQTVLRSRDEVVKGAIGAIMEIANLDNG